MKNLLIGLALSAVCAAPAFAALKVGDTAPDFTAKASLGGKEFTFSLADALKKGPAVVYFYPSAYTGGCDLEAHTFAEQSDKFATAGATIIGVSADDLGRLKQFSADPKFCAGKFPIASDADTKIAQSYNLNVTPPRAGANIIGVSADNMQRLNQFAADPAFCAGKFPIASDESLTVAKSYNLSTTPPRDGAKDVRGVEIGHGFIERVTYVIGKDHKVIAVMSSAADKLTPDQHVDKSLEIVSAK